MRKPALLFLSVSLALAACTGRSSETPVPEPVTLEGMANTVRVGDLLFGGQPTTLALEHLSREGYKTVLNTRGVGELEWDEEKQVESLGMAYAAIPMPYPIESITDAQVKAFADFMDHAAPPVVVHCSSGNRVAGLWAVWLVEHEGMSPEQALDLGTKAGMTRIRPAVEKRLEK